MSSVFWGLKLEPGKRYSTTVDKSFHISMAALDCTKVKSGSNDPISVMLEDEGGAYIICNLHKERMMQSHLDLNFMTGDRITLYCKGIGEVHLSGYMVLDDDEFTSTMEDEETDEEDDIDIEEEEDENQTFKTSLKDLKKEVKENKAAKRKESLSQTSPANKSKKLKLEAPKPGNIIGSEDEDDTDEDDNKYIFLDEDETELFDEEESEGESDEDDEEEEEEEEEEIKLQIEKKKKKKSQDNVQKLNTSASMSPKQTPQKSHNQNIVNGVVSSQSGKKEKKKKETQAQGSPKKPEESPQKSTLTGGVTVKDIRFGNGPLCKAGKLATVYYTGRLKSNNKVFDSVIQGSGFKFRVGRGEVIKGWDTGISGMKVGGKRIITCPPQAAYGPKGSPPAIPPNSTLVFEVELRAVN